MFLILKDNQLNLELMEDKIVNNLIYGYPFFFPIWKAPIDQQKTLQASFEDGTMSADADFSIITALLYVGPLSRFCT